MSSCSLPLHPLTLSLALALLPASVLAQTGPETDTPPPSKTPEAARQERPRKPGTAAELAEQLQRVEVSGRPSDEAQRRASTAAKIVIGREEIERYGDSTIGEVLKRLPGVTTGGRPGRGGDIRMRGMGGGYTQILVNGERMPPGFSLDQLPPEQIERIEVMRAPTAEFGARAVAGTINVVLREALQRKLNELRLALSAERDQLRPSVGWTRNDKLDDNGGAYNLTINASQSKRVDDSESESLTQYLSSGNERRLTTRGQSSDERRSLNVTARLQWRLGGGDSLSLQPFAVVSDSATSNRFQQTQTPRAEFGAADFYNFNNVHTEGDNRFTMLRLNSQWTKRLSEDSRLELRGGIGKASGQGHSFRQEFESALEQRSQDDQTRSDNRSWSLNGKYSRQLENEHNFVAGLEAEGTSSQQSRLCQQGIERRPPRGCDYLLAFGDDINASTERIAAYAQDEWSAGKQWSFYAGLRWEGIKTASSAANYSVANRSSVATPLLHALYKLDEKNREQIRMSLTRSYKSPNVQDLIARPNINSQYPCRPDCGANEANYADRTGNPELKPELATGVDLAYEKYLSKGGILSANFFFRRINDLIRTDPRLELVSWAPVPRWVARPRNIGDARTMGVELEAKFRLDEYLTDAWPINVRSNLSLFKSKVAGIAGPDNKLDQQPQYTANLGADYKLRSLPLTLGAGLNYTPANAVQQSALLRVSNSHKRVLDAFANWALTPDTLLRLSASNLVPLEYSNASTTLTADKLIRGESGGRSYTVWQLRLELKV